MSQPIDYPSLVLADRVHSRIFTDPGVFDDEMDRIFHRCWVYVGHESEVAQPGDYVTRWIGRQPMILTRDEDGLIHVLANRCRHRGNAVCQLEAGTANYFRCPYHGWTYKNSGDLVGVPYPEGYGPSFDEQGLGLAPAARVDTHQGFVFASLVPGGPDLRTFLGHAAEFFDNLVLASPTGRIRLGAGVQKTVFTGNWKYVGMDGYHVNFTHRSINRLSRRNSGTAKAYVGSSASYSGTSQNTTVDLGGGHVRLDSTPQIVEYVEEYLQARRSTESGRAYIDALVAAYGEDRLHDVLIRSKDPHLGLFPNVQLITNHIRVIRPIAVDRTEVHSYPIILEGVPEEVNEERLRRHEWFYGPSGFGQPDDSEMFERNQMGLQNTLEPWLLIGRGMEREKHLPDGTIVGHITDETTQRGQFKGWLAAMSGVPAATGTAVRA